MATYSVESINAIFLPNHQVPGRPTFLTLWKLSQELQECLGHMEHTDHPYEGYAGYTMTQVDYALYSTTRWKDKSGVGNYFIVSTTDITNTDQKYEENKWQAGKNLMDTYRNMHTDLRKLF